LKQVPALGSWLIHSYSSNKRTIFCVAKRDVIFIETNKQLLRFESKKHRYVSESLCLPEFSKNTGHWVFTCSLKFWGIKLPTPTATPFEAK
jgi:hypothetical protein